MFEEEMEVIDDEPIPKYIPNQCPKNNRNYSIHYFIFIIDLFLGKKILK